MNEIEKKINDVLAKWDIIGVQNIDPMWPLYEYESYVNPIINSYTQKGDVYEAVLKMFVAMKVEATTKDLETIRTYSKEINKIISSS